jgi:transposase
VKGNKHDAADAEAICEAVSRQSMRFVPIKNLEQQAVLSLTYARKSSAPSSRCDYSFASFAFRLS